MKNIHLLPTDKPSKGYILGKCIKELSDVKIGQFTRTHYLMFDEEYFQAHNIYITSEENTKLGDWCLDTLSDILFISDGNLNLHRRTDKKIILTTDPDLIEDGVQAIDDEFLQWFIKNPNCESIEIIQMCGTCGAEGKEGDNYCERSKECNRGWAGEKYKIIIPKDLDQIVGQKMYEQRDFEIIINTEFYAESYARQMWGEYYDNEYDTGMDLTYGEVCKNDFLMGIEYQKQQNKNLYSEEEVLSILRGFELTYDGKASESKLQKWFEKYKKK